ncbi:hypothetical protein [Streptacidiphilus albus]|uniref:hypothetical protein n=1 Tax=Streptacidiphilus albus TaxID=105425 RepID=UPI000A4237F6|nr:hypothetical protein [Streptacidiphilus albus]
MSELTAGGPGAAFTFGRADSAPRVRRTPAETRRLLQLALAAVWLLDGLLQLQPFMFTKAFATQIIDPTAPGNPSAVAHSITWAAGIIGHHPVGTNAAFAAIQLLLGLGIACRPTVRAALAASVGWSLAVWWFGEGLGGVLTGGASPLSGAPGGVILYALLAVLLWPTDREGPFPAARPVGVAAARGLWLLLWGSLVFFTLESGNTGSQDMNAMIAGMADGQPDWLGAIIKHSASLVAHRGLAASIGLAAVLALVAVAVFLPPRLWRALIALALVLSAVIWVVGEAVGGVFGGQGTDPNSGPLLALIALAYWPATHPTTEPKAVAQSATGDLERTTS